MNRLICALLVLIMLVLNACSSQDKTFPIRMIAPWVRATAPGQDTVAGYIRLQSSKAARLIKITSPQAGSVGIHRMSNHNGVMKMEELADLDLPENQTVELAPNGLHLMLIGVKQPLKVGDEVTLTLTFEFADKSTLQLNAGAEVRDR